MGGWKTPEAHQTKLSPKRSTVIHLVKGFPIKLSKQGRHQLSTTAEASWRDPSEVLSKEETGRKSCTLAASGPSAVLLVF